MAILQGLQVNGKPKFVKTYAPGGSEHLSILKLDELIALVVSLQTSYNALLAKLDADTGVTDTDYESSLESTTAIRSASDDLIGSPPKEDI